MKKFNGSFLALIIIVLSTSAQAQVSSGQALNYQANQAHTGTAESFGLTPPLKQKWAVNFGKSISYPLIASGRVFVTVAIAPGSGTRLYALDAASGATLWSFALGAYSQWSASCYEDGRVFAINGDGLLRAFDATNGNIIWTRQLSQYSFSAAPTVFQGVIYTGGAGSGGTAYAISAETGNVIWQVPVSGGAQSSPAVTGEGVYLSYSCPNVYKLNPANGAVIWRYAPGCSGGGGKTPALYNGRLYVRDSSSDSIFDSQTGGMTGGFIAKNIPVFSGSMGFFLNGPKYFGSFGTLEGRDLNNNNSLVWSFAGDGFLQSSLLVVNDVVYVGSEKGKLYAVNAATGQQVWTTNVGTSIPYVDEQNVSQPLTGFAAGEGLLVIPTATTLVAFEADPAPTISWGYKTPAANTSGWNNSAVELPFTASARTGGVTFSTPGSPLQFSSQGGNQTQQVTASDEAGNTATYTSPIVNIDWTAPVTTKTISGTTGNDGWYTSAAQVWLTASDPISGIRSINYQVDGGAPQTYVGPFSISSEGSHTVSYWSEDAAGNTESQQAFGILVDVNAPSTQASVSGTPNGSGWYRDHQVTLTASDTSSGVATTYYTVDGGTTQTYSGPFSVSSDGSHVIYYWSVDVAGKAETQRILYVRTDNTAPTTDLSSTGTNGWNLWRTSAVQVTLWPSDDSRSGVATTYYTVDGGATQTYTGPFTVDGNGQHPINFWSVDNVGNTEVQKTSTVKIDKDGPVTETAVSGPVGNNNYFTGPVQVSLTATDAVAGMAYTTYQLDGGTMKSYSSAFSVTGDGTHAVHFWSTDMAGNVSEGSRVVNIDSMAPSTQATLAGTVGANGWYSTPAQVTLGATDSTSGIANTYYAIDGGQPQTYSAPFTIPTSGTHTVLYWSVDPAGNTEAQKSLTVKVDVSAPSTQASTYGTSYDAWYQSPAQVGFTKTDGDSGVANTYYTIDGGATQTYSGLFNVSDGGIHVVNYWSVDTAGNSEEQKSLTVKVDNTAPSTQISTTGTTGTNGWYRSSVQVSLAGSDSQSGVNVTLYRVDGGLTQVYSGAFTISGDGQHQVSYWSNDKVSNTEAQQTATINIDQTVPATQNSVSGPAGGNGYFKGAAQVTLTATDTLSGVANKYYRVDGGAIQTYAAAFTVSGDGNHAVDFWSIDGAGNTAGASTVMVRIDATAPLTQTTTSGTAGTNGWYRGPAQVSLTATDNLSGVANRYYKVDGGATQTFSTPFTISAAGTHTINFWSMDQANNTEPTGSLVVKIDSSAPVITASASPSTSTKSNKLLSVTVSGRVTDTPSGVKPNSTTYSVVDEYGVTQPSGSVTLQTNGNYSFTLSLPRTRNNGDSNGHLYTITVRADDQAGNSGAASTTVKIL